MMSIQGVHVQTEIVLTCVRWSVAPPVSDRPGEEMRQERGVAVDHATSNRWVLTYRPRLEAGFHHRQRPVWTIWRLDETSIRVHRHWRYRYRAVEQAGHTSDLLLTVPRDAFSPRPSAVMGRQRRSPVMGVRPMRLRSGGTTRRLARR
jgi:transposase-like protein